MEVKKTFKSARKISIFTIYNSSQDVLWIGTDGQGILKVYKYKSPFHTIKTNYPTRCFCEEDNGNILAGTKGEGILLIDKQNGKAESYLTIADGLISILYMLCVRICQVTYS